MDILSYLISKGLHLKDSGSEWMGICPYCKKENHFYINKLNGLWKCHAGACGQTGSISSLKRFFGDAGQVVSMNDVMLKQYEKTKVSPDWLLYQNSIDLLLNDKVQLKWLEEERGINIDTVRHFKLGAKYNKFSPRNKSNITWIEYPLVAGGQFVNVKFRSGAGYSKDFAFIPGCPLPLFNHDGISPNEYIILCEGEMDAMVLWQQGFKNVLSTTGGASTFKPEWYDYIKSINPQVIFIVYDSDDAGQKMAKDLCSRFEGLAKNIVLPEGKDPTDYFVKHKHTSDEFQALLDKAALSDIEFVYSPVTVIDNLIKEMEGQDLSPSELVTPFQSVNKLIGGKFEPGELIVFTARAKVGKTTFAQFITYNMAKKSDVPVLFMCLEMRPERLIRKMVCMSQNKEDENLNVNDLLRAKEELTGIQFYFSYFWDNVTMETVEKVFTQARNKYGIKIAVFDNLHYLCRSKEHTVQEIGILSKRFKMLAEKLAIPIILIVQPRRVTGIPSSEDLKDSSAIKADADKVIVLHRVPMMASPDVGASNEIVDAMIAPLEESLHPLTMIKCDATRFSSGGSTALWYDGSRSIFREATRSEIEDFKELYSRTKEKENVYKSYKPHGRSEY